MVARAYTVAFEGVEARIVEVQCAVAPGLPAFSSWACPTRRCRRRANACAPRSPRCPSRCRRSASPSTSRPPTCPRKAPTSTCPSRWRSSPRSTSCRRTRSRRPWRWANCRSTARSSPSRARCPPRWRRPRRTAPRLPPRLRRRGRLGRRGRGHRPASLPTRSATSPGRASLDPASEPGEVTTDRSHLRDLADVRGTGTRQARAGDRGGGAAPPPDGRHAGLGQVDARRPPARHPAAADGAEALETSMIHSLSGLLDEGGISRERPFREPHHTASMAAIVGGGKGAKPGEISLAHNGVLFLDEFPEFPRTVLETLRQPIETGDVVVARANAHVRYPCRFMLIAAANPCKCGYLSDPGRACTRAPACGEDYMGRISGPLMDRFDLRVEVPPVAFTDLDLPESGERSATVAARVAMPPARRRTRRHPGALNADLVGRAARRGRHARRRRPRASRPRSPNASASRRAATTASCASPAPSPTSRARTRSAAPRGRGGELPPRRRRRLKARPHEGRRLRPRLSRLRAASRRRSGRHAACRARDRR
jgi:magnesium chelatase family protein